MKQHNQEDKAGPIPVAQKKDIQLQLKMSPADHANLLDSVEKLEAANQNEVVRRALFALQGELPDEKESARAGVDSASFKNMHLRISPRTKAYMERLKGQSGISDAELISRALNVFVQQLRQAEEIFAPIRSGQMPRIRIAIDPGIYIPR